jgi:hypothetical protein
MALSYSRFEKAGPNSQFRGIYICNNLIPVLSALSSAEFLNPPPHPKNEAKENSGKLKAGPK